ncbi:hypothetical protein HOT82_gp097 [Gordonia phage Ronaldo]|uniref:Uncharacterized protein n=3 Tax=Ronaldovirus TaxID=2733205 RepID=A0A6B9LAH2_9CAUD|nr:hypothetical protein HOT81_gp094 [Gordonia phage Fryberger]YP_009807793.1 hypothetical protein HOT82_gp097 [Gordonia phage Ronaldo]QHB38213.1 hypothetical protein SEA_VOLT_98 [Gordonia phage Volt]QTF81883.1 hypothetical protein SEA_GUEY18_99 [Gordonia phage Guey18]AXN53511.1 hypothetical protein SEA_FRYBERGER_94 [Gordonia phage Fryberger]AXN53659.1 hypothetical protein SEA_RONALDO_97 [Gordonia phage Ronaldo]
MSETELGWTDPTKPIYYNGAFWALPPQPFSQRFIVGEKKEEEMFDDNSTMEAFDRLPEALQIRDHEDLTELPVGAMVMDIELDIMVRQDDDDYPFRQVGGEFNDTNIDYDSLLDWLPCKLIHHPDWWPGYGE